RARCASCNGCSVEDAGSRDPQGGARTCHGVKKTAAAAAVAAEGQFPMTTVAEVIGVSRSNLMERMRERPKKRIGRRPLPDDKLGAEIRAVIAELPTYGYRRVHAILKRQALADGLKPSNHKRVYRVMKVHGLLLDAMPAAPSGAMTDASPSMSATAAGAPTALRLAATTVNACGSPSRSIAVIARP